MLSKTGIAVLACLFSVLSLTAQQADGLKGIVVETDAKGRINPIEGATVHWLNAVSGAATDSNGIFFLPWNEQTRRLVVSFVGYRTDTILVQEQRFVRVIMISKGMLDEVNVTYERKSTEISYLDPWKTTIMNEKELFKAACCNLAESFETNPSVDVAFTDALTGARQIQMLGLAGQYTQATQENIPSVRGIAAPYGFTYTPGTWLNSIQVSKGMGSVVNGFESISGLINTELHKPDVKEHLYLNAYASEGGRYELNLNLAQKLSSSFSQSLLTHGSILNQRIDNNHDGFLDNPLGYQWNVLYRWQWDRKKGFMMQGGVRLLRDEKTGGSFAFDNRIDTSSAHPLYGTKVVGNRAEGWVKIGYVFPKRVYKSIGLQVSGVRQTYDSYFGLNAYNGKQHSLYGNLIYQSIIGSSDHKFRTGLSNQSDFLDETLLNYGTAHFARNEIVTGGFFEYTYSRSDRFAIVGGLRGDYNNLFGAFATPRLHVRYAMTKRSVLRLSAGRGQRTANVIAENLGLLASSRAMLFSGDSLKYAYGFKPEVAWNYGLNFTHDFKLNYRPGTVTLDYYYTDFQNQVVVDRDVNPRQIVFHSLQGRSYSHSFQAQLDYQPVRRLSTRFAYRLYDVRTQYQSGLLAAPLIAKHRAFANAAYETKNKWSFDATFQWTGQKRLPGTSLNPSDKQAGDFSDAFTTVNAQVTKGFLKPRIDLYLGVENLLDFKQTNAIVDAQNPFGPYFDAAMIWGPVFGRMLYGGIRFKL